MKAIAGGNLAGFPTELITVYVECEIIGEKADMTVLDYIMSDPKVIAAAAEESAVITMLTDMGFGVSRTAAAITAEVGTLSGTILDPYRCHTRHQYLQYYYQYH